MEVDGAERHALHDTQMNEHPSTSAEPDSITERLGLRPFDVLDDISCIAEQYCAQGFQAFDQAVVKSERFDKEELKITLQGSLKVFQHTLGNLRTGLSSFDKTALSSSLRIPPILTQPQPLQGPDRLPDETAEEEIDRKLAHVRKRILEAKAATRSCQHKTASISNQIFAYGDHSSLQEVVNPVSAGKENLTEDAAAIAEKGLQLIPLLKNAQAVFAKRQESRIDQTPSNVAVAAEREAAARKAAANGCSVQDLQCLGECVALE